MYFHYIIVKYCLCILFALIFICAEDIPEDIIPILYSKYMEAINNVTVSTNVESHRRLFRHEREYRVHVKKLKEVNGFKTHNLLVKEETRKGNPIIYINNPVETKIPHAFLTLEEFKKVLTNRVEKGIPTLITKQEKGYSNVARIGSSKYITRKLKNDITIISTEPTRTVVKPAGVIAKLVIEKKIKRETIPNIHITRDNISTRNLKGNTTRLNSTSKPIAAASLTKLTTNTVRATSTIKNLVTKETITVKILTQPTKETSVPNLVEKSTTNNVTSTKEFTTVPIITTKMVEPAASQDGSTTETMTTIEKLSANNLEQEKFTESLKIAESTVKGSTSTITKTTRPKPLRPYVFMGGFE